MWLEDTVQRRPKQLEIVFESYALLGGEIFLLDARESYHASRDHPERDEIGTDVTAIQINLLPRRVSFLAMDIELT